MAIVEHMKWWGWGREGVAFHHEDKPALTPFVKEAVGLDLDRTPPQPMMAFEDLQVPAPMVGDDVLATLRNALGDQYVLVDDRERVVHTYGKSLRDLIRLRRGDLPRVPDVVVYPADEEQVRAVVECAVMADAVLIPFGGGSNISGSLHPPVGETRPVISVDMGRMNRVLDIDEDSGLARVQAGVHGPHLEEQLADRGWTMGHFPDSFTHSTLGGWVATRSSGMQSDKYGDIADIARGLRVVRPDGVLTLRPLPSTSTGPSVREMLIGSEGRLGVITEVTVQVHRTPAHRDILAYLFPSWEAGVAAMQAISVSEASPSVTRVSDAGETRFSFATKKDTGGKGLSAKAQDVLMSTLRRRGWNLDEACLSFIGFEGTAATVTREKAQVLRIVARHGGIPLGKGPGKLYDQKKFDTPYIRDFLLDRGAAADVSETAAPWSRLQTVYTNTVAAAHRAFAELGVTGWIMCHLSHSYHSGACLYFTFAFTHGQEDPLGEYQLVKGAVQQAFVDSQGTLSHHHAVGTEHSPWLGQDISPAGVGLLTGLFDSADPGRNFNPGKIVPGHPRSGDSGRLTP